MPPFLKEGGNVSIPPCWAKHIIHMKKVLSLKVLPPSKENLNISVQQAIWLLMATVLISIPQELFYVKRTLELYFYICKHIIYIIIYNMANKHHFFSQKLNQGTSVITMRTSLLKSLNNLLESMSFINCFIRVKERQRIKAVIQLE